jgi:hypothetical protein
VDHGNTVSICLLSVLTTKLDHDLEVFRRHIVLMYSLPRTLALVIFLTQHGGAGFTSATTRNG